MVLGHAAPEAGDGGEVLLREPDLLLPGLREGLVVRVLQEDQRAELRLVSLFHERRVADGAYGLLRVQVGILEQAHAEHVQEDSPGGFPEPLLCVLFAEVTHPEGIGVPDILGIVGSADLVTARQENAVVALGHGKPLDPPGLAAAGVVHAGVVQGDAPVRADDSVESRFLAELFPDDPRGEGPADLLAGRILAPQDGVSGHDSRGAAGAAIQLEGALYEGTQVLLKIVAREDCVLAVGEVAVTAALLGAIAVPVLGHGIDASITPGAVDPLPFGTRLEAVAVSPGQVRGEVRILPEGTVEAPPAGLCGNVHLRTQGGRDAERPVFDGGNLSEPLHQGRVEGRGEAQGRGPAGDGPAAAGIELQVRRRLVAGIRMDGHRDALSHPFRVCLDRVVPAGGHFGAFHRGDEHPAEMALAEELFLLVGHFPGMGAARLEGGPVVTLHGTGPFHHVGDEGRDGLLVGEVLFLLGGKFRHVDGRGVGFPVPRGLEEIAECPDEGGLAHQFLLGVGEFHLRFDGAASLRRDGLVVADEEEARDLIDGEASRQVLRPFRRREPPVLVRIQHAVAVEVLEGLSVGLEDCYARGGTVTEDGAVLLRDGDEIPVGCLARAAGEYGKKEESRRSGPERMEGKRCRCHSRVSE